MKNFNIKIDNFYNAEQIFQPSFDWKEVSFVSKHQEPFKIHFDLYTTTPFAISYLAMDQDGVLCTKFQYMNGLSSKELKIFEQGDKKLIIEFLKLLQDNLLLSEDPEFLFNQIRILLKKCTPNELKTFRNFKLT